MKKPTDDLRRIPASRIPREVATRALLSPRITGKSRRLFMRARDLVVDIERSERTNEQESYCAGLKRLTIRQLGRRATQLRHKLSEAERTLTITVLETPRKFVEQYIAILRYQSGWLRQEADRRANGVLKETIDDTGN